VFWDCVGNRGASERFGQRVGDSIVEERRVDVGGYAVLALSPLFLCNVCHWDLDVGGSEIVSVLTCWDVTQIGFQAVALRL